MAKKKSVWALVPSRKPEDQLYNRRLMSYFALAFSALWFQEVLVVIIIGMIFKAPVEAAVVVALLGVPTTLAGLGFYKYLQACNVVDHKGGKNAAGTTESEPPEPVEEAKE